MEDNINIREQFIELNKLYPGLQLMENSESYCIEGDITINAEYNNAWIIDDYSIQIHVPFNFPQRIPSVYETSHKIPRGYRHFLDNGALCLGVTAEIYRLLYQNSTLIFFVNTFVINYLYSVSYFVKYGIMPFGERAHGSQGIYEYYKDFFKVKTDGQALAVLMFVALGNYRGHIDCPCGSGEKIRKCIHKDIIFNAINSEFHSCYQADCLELMKRRR